MANYTMAHRVMEEVASSPLLPGWKQQQEEMTGDSNSSSSGGGGPVSLLDFGCGPGLATLAALNIWPHSLQRIQVSHTWLFRV